MSQSLVQVRWIRIVHVGADLRAETGELDFGELASDNLASELPTELATWRSLVFRVSAGRAQNSTKTALLLPLFGLRLGIRRLERRLLSARAGRRPNRRVQRLPVEEQKVAADQELHAHPHDQEARAEAQ